MAINNNLQGYLDAKGHAYAVGTTTATLTSSTLSAQQLEDLIRASHSQGWRVSLAAGVLTLKPA